MNSHAHRTDLAEPVEAFRLANGLDVVVVKDRRAPVVTHMVWYRNGSADDPVGKSGIAHFLEHLMFKGTERWPAGEFSKIVAGYGGQENAFTSFDYTAYFQRVPKEHLRAMMDYEADRMTGLSFDEGVVAPERDVVLEERRMRVDSDPAAQLGEEFSATLFFHHPYGTPIIGWEHEIERLSRDDAFAYYQRFYTPENAILVVAGDTDAAEVRRLAEDTYGRIAARGAAPVRSRPVEPEPRASRRVQLNDPRVQQPSLRRGWLTPTYTAGERDEVLALELVAEILGGGTTSRLYRRLCVEDELAAGASAYFMARWSIAPPSSSPPARAPASRWRRWKRGSMRRSPPSWRTGRASSNLPAPAPDWWPRRSSPATTSPRWPASSARRWPWARRSKTCSPGPSGSRPSDATP